jgi:succinylarginine dihydrolase
MFGSIANIHDPVSNISGYGDEGAANHLRVSAQHLKPGFQIFVYGNSALRAIKVSLLVRRKKYLKPWLLNTSLIQI